MTVPFQAARGLSWELRKSTDWSDTTNTNTTTTTTLVGAEHLQMAKEGWRPGLHTPKGY